jgi:hypothetical protein
MCSIVIRMKMNYAYMASLLFQLTRRSCRISERSLIGFRSQLGNISKRLKNYKENDFGLCTVISNDACRTAEITSGEQWIHCYTLVSYAPGLLTAIFRAACLVGEVCWQHWCTGSGLPRVWRCDFRSQHPTLEQKAGVMVSCVAHSALNWPPSWTFEVVTCL